MLRASGVREQKALHLIMRFFPIRLLLASLLALSVIAPAAGATPHIKWKLENPFRFFTDPADTEMHRATYQALNPRARLSPVLSAERALQARHEDGWAARMYRKTCWTASSNRFACPAYDDYMLSLIHISEPTRPY